MNKICVLEIKEEWGGKSLSRNSDGWFYGWYFGKSCEIYCNKQKFSTEETYIINRFYDNHRKIELSDNRDNGPDPSIIHSRSYSESLTKSLIKLLGEDKYEGISDTNNLYKIEL